MLLITAPGSTGIMSAAANTLRQAEGEVVPAWLHLLHPLRALLGEGAPLAGAVLITSAIKCQTGIYLSR